MDQTAGRRRRSGKCREEGARKYPRRLAVGIVEFSGTPRPYAWVERRGPARARRAREIQATVDGVGNPAGLVHAVHGRGNIHRVNSGSVQPLDYASPTVGLAFSDQ